MAKASWQPPEQAIDFATPFWSPLPWACCPVIMFNPASFLSEEALLCSQVRVQDARNPRVCRTRLSGLCSVHGVCERTGIPVTKVAPPSELPHAFNFSLFALPHETEESFVQRKIFIQASLSEESALIVGQVFGFYSLLNSVRTLPFPLPCQLF